MVGSSLQAIQIVTAGVNVVYRVAPSMFVLIVLQQLVDLIETDLINSTESASPRRVAEAPAQIRVARWVHSSQALLSHLPRDSVRYVGRRRRIGRGEERVVAIQDPLQSASLVH